LRGVSETVAGLSVGEAPGLVGALMRRDQNCRDLLPDPVNFPGSFVSGRCGTLQVRKFSVELNELLLELSEPLIDDRTVVALPGNWKARGGFPRAQPISSVEQTT